MPTQTGPTSDEGKAESSRNAVRHGLNSLQPVITEATRPEHEALVSNLLLLKPGGYLQELTFQRLVNAAWNMQRCLKLENQLREHLADDDPLGDPETIHQAALYQRYYLRFEGAYRANLRELERLQRLQMIQDIHAGVQEPVGALHDLDLYQRLKTRNPRPLNRVRNEIRPPTRRSAVTPPAPAAPAVNTSAAAASTLPRSSTPPDVPTGIPAVCVARTPKRL